MFLSFLSVICVWTVLAHIVLLDEQWVHREVWVNRESYESHLGTLLHNLCVVNSVVGRCSPRERTVVLNQNGRSVIRIDLADVQDFVDDDVTRLQLIGTLDLFLVMSRVQGMSL